MAEFPAMPLWTDAYLADTRHLSTHEHGAYLLLLMSAWRTPDCSLPDDDRVLARLAGMNGGRWARCKGTVMAFFELGDDARWRQKRLTKERSRVETQRSQKRTAGRASARAKSQKQKETDSTAVVEPLQREDNGEATNHIHNQNPPCSPPKGDGKKGGESDFEAWWEHVPRKVAKGQARRAYKTALKKTDAETLLAGIKRYAEAVRGKDAEFIRHPATWLNGEGWLDEPDPAPQGKREWWMGAPLPAHAREPAA